MGKKVRGCPMLFMAWRWPRSPASSESFIWLCPFQLHKLEVGVSEGLEQSLNLRTWCGAAGRGEALPTNHVPGAMGSACTHTELHRFVYILFLDK